MKSPAIIDPAAIAATGRQAAVQFEAAPDVPFNHVLSREVANRNDAAPAPAVASATPSSSTQASSAPAPQSGPQSTQSTQSTSAAKGTDKDKADKHVDEKDKDKTAKDAADSADQTDPASLLALVANIGQLTSNASAKAAPADDKAGADLGKDAISRKVDLKAARDAGRPDTATQAADTKVQPDDKGVDFAGELKRSSDVQQQVAGAADTARLPAQAAAEVIATDAAAKQIEAANLPTAASAQAAAALTAAQQAAQTVLRAAPGHASDVIAPKVGTPGWDQAVGQRVVWMVAGAEQSASLTLNPPDLGPLQVVLNVSNSTANATFVAAQPEVRQALEAALPRLRDMLGDAGIQLGQATVSSGMQQNQGDAQAQQSQASQRGFGAAGNVRSDVPDTQIHVSRGRAVSAGNGLVDTFV